MSEQHRHKCENGRLCYCADTWKCAERGYCLCECGATRGASRDSEWINSHATKRQPHERFWPGERRSA